MVSRFLWKKELSGQLSEAPGVEKRHCCICLAVLDALDRRSSVGYGKTALQKLSEEEKTLFRRRNIGFIFQNYNLVSTLSVWENITLPLLLDGAGIDQEFMGEMASEFSKN